MLTMRLASPDKFYGGYGKSQKETSNQIRLGTHVQIMILSCYYVSTATFRINATIKLCMVAYILVSTSSRIFLGTYQVFKMFHMTEIFKIKYLYQKKSLYNISYNFVKSFFGKKSVLIPIARKIYRKTKIVSQL